MLRYEYRRARSGISMGKGGVGKRRSNKGFQRTGGTALARSSVVQAEVRSGFAPAAEPWAFGCIR